MKRFLISALAALASVGAAAAIEPVNQTLLGGLAVDGYDVVAYFTEGRPVEGSARHEHEWNGATWRFANDEHRELFAKEPEKYAPAYGGYCAWAVAHDYTADTDPEAWAIVDGRLYLNYDQEVRERWILDRKSYIERADANWPRLRDAD